MVQLQHISIFANVFKTSTICQNFFTEMSLQMVSAQGIMEDNYANDESTTLGREPFKTNFEVVKW